MTTSSPRLDRRSFLSRVGQTAAATTAVATLAGYGPLLAAPGSRWFKIGACEWSLGRADPTVFDVAKEIGLDGVQLNMGSLKDDMHLRRADVQQAYAAAAQRVGLQISSLAIGEMNRVPLKSDPRAAAWLAESLDICQALRLPIVMPAFFSQGDLDMSKTAEIDHVVSVIRDVAPRAEKAGITIGLENYLSAADNMTILQRIGSPAVKVYYDVGNSTDKGRDVTKEIRQLGKLICEFHFKDAKFMLGQGRIDFKQVRAAIDDIGYSGWMQLEAAHPHGLQADYTTHYKYLRGIFPERG